MRLSWDIVTRFLWEWTNQKTQLRFLPNLPEISNVPSRGGSISAEMDAWPENWIFNVEGPMIPVKSPEKSLMLSNLYSTGNFRKFNDGTSVNSWPVMCRVRWSDSTIAQVMTWYGLLKWRVPLADWDIVLSPSSKRVYYVAQKEKSHRSISLCSVGPIFDDGD